MSDETPVTNDRAAQLEGRIVALLERQQQWLELIAHLSREIPFSEEVEDWDVQRRFMIAALGTARARARVAELERMEDREVQRRLMAFAWAQAAYSVAQAVSLQQPILEILEEAIGAHQAVGGDAFQVWAAAMEQLVKL